MRSRENEGLPREGEREGGRRKENSARRESRNLLANASAIYFVYICADAALMTSRPAVLTRRPDGNFPAVIYSLPCCLVRKEIREKPVF